MTQFFPVNVIQNLDKRIQKICKKLIDNPEKFKIIYKSRPNLISSSLDELKLFLSAHPEQIRYLNPNDQRVELQQAAIESDPEVVKFIYLPDHNVSQLIVKKNPLLLGYCLEERGRRLDDMLIAPDPTPGWPGTRPSPMTDDDRQRLFEIALGELFQNPEYSIENLKQLTQDQKHLLVNSLCGHFIRIQEFFNKRIQHIIRSLSRHFGKKILKWIFTFLDEVFSIKLSKADEIRFFYEQASELRDVQEIKESSLQEKANKLVEQIFD